jgi:hypothetical protein
MDKLAVSFSDEGALVADDVTAFETAGHCLRIRLEANRPSEAFAY